MEKSIKFGEEYKLNNNQPEMSESVSKQNNTELEIEVNRYVGEGNSGTCTPHCNDQVNNYPKPNVCGVAEAGVAKSKPKKKKKQKVSESSDPDVDIELSTPDVIEILKSGNTLIYSCNTCRESCDTLREFNLHSKKHVNVVKVSFTKFYSCSLCVYTCKRAASLLKHIDKHGKRKYGCEACDYTTNRPSVLKLHLLTHSAERPFACSECSFRALQEGQLRHHYLKKHDITFE